MILTAILTLALILCVGVIYEQNRTIKRLRRRLLEALDWIEPDDLVRGDCNGNCSSCMNAEVDP